MYAPHFGLQAEPFSIAPDPRYLFMSERHREALAHLLYGLQGGGGFVLLTGEIGAGKTTVCRCFLEQVPPSCDVAYVFNPRLTVVELLRTVCDEFGLALPPDAATVKQHIDPLNAFLLRSHAAGRHAVLVIDEAQNLGPELLEQLRLLTNLETAERKLLQIVLIGQPELRDTLAGMEQLAQRVIARYHLQALSEAETAQYVRHRLAVAGLVGELPFDRAALRRIHALARGVPRRINLLCDRALLGAYAQGRHRVDARTVVQAAHEVFGTPLPTRRPLAWAAAGGLALAAAGVLAWQQGVRAPAGRPVAPADTAASAPAAAASAASAVEAPISAASAAAVPVPADDLSPPLALLGSELAAWRELADRWPLQEAGRDPCSTVPGLECFRTSAATLPLLRQLDRPGLLALRDAQGRAGWALLVALDERTATLRAGGRERRLPLAELAPLWQGGYATFWRAPPGYQRALALGDSGAAVQALAQRLARAGGRDDAAPGAGFDAALAAQLTAFQLAQGLQPDGRAGPTTFMLLNRASGHEPGPRLAR